MTFIFSLSIKTLFVQIILIFLWALYLCILSFKGKYLDYAIQGKL